MSDEFLKEMREAPRSAFVHVLRDRLRGPDAASGARIRVSTPVPVLVTAAVVLLLVGSLAFPSVRATAQAVLDLFRERTVVAVEFDPARFAQLRDRFLETHRSPVLLVFGEPDVLQSSGTPVAYPTLAAAAGATGLALREPAWLPAGLALDHVEVSGERRERVRVDPERLHATIDLLDLREVSVPRELAEGAFEVHLPRTTAVHYGSADGSIDLVHREASGVELSPSPGLDLALLGEIGLRVVGLEAGEAQRLAESIDWPATLNVPMPLGASSFDEVTVQGRPGLLISGRSDRVLLWSEAGRVHALSGNLAAGDLVQVAESTR